MGTFSNIKLVLTCSTDRLLRYMDQLGSCYDYNRSGLEEGNKEILIEKHKEGKYYVLSTKVLWTDTTETELEAEMCEKYE